MYCIDFLSAMLTPIIAIVATWIAYQQWRTSEDVNKLNKYEKRYSVYEALKKALLEIVSQSNISRESLDKLTVKTGECVFIFDNYVVNYIKEFREKALRVYQINRSLRTDTDNKEESASELLELEGWFQKQHQELIDQFMPHLKFRK